MGAGQIGGIATMVDFDFNNAAGFWGTPASVIDGQFVVFYMSHAMLFCTGALIEPHVVLTPASCVFGESYKFEVYGGSHKFLEHSGVSRTVENLCVHRKYNHTSRWWNHCVTENIALLVLDKQFVVRYREPHTEYIMNRVRYGVPYEAIKESMQEKKTEIKCQYYGWGSRRNGFLIPLLIHMRKMEVSILDSRYCDEIWNSEEKFLCLSSPHCTNEKYGALCPDDLGSVLVCGGYVQGMMTSHLVDRPCGTGFLNIAPFIKFMECAVDDSRDATEFTYMKIPADEEIPEAKIVMINKSNEDQTVMTTQCTTGDCLTTHHGQLTNETITPTPPPAIRQRQRKKKYKHGR